MVKKSFLFLASIVFFSAINGDMRIHEHLTQLFAYEPVNTEYLTYQLLKENPLKADVNYLAIPWVVLINYNKLDKVPAIKLDGGFTICQHIKFERIIPILKRIGIDTLFCPHIEKGKVYDGITVLPFPHFAKNGADPASKKDILYSFVGIVSHPVRRKIFALPEREDTFVTMRKSWGAFASDKPENIEYQELLSRSRFALCPRGTGASTIRFWEALQAGAIPVLISDAMMLPAQIDWSSCIIQVPENQASLVDEIIRAIPEDVEQEMRACCLEVYNILCSGNNFVYTIRDHYDTIDVPDVT